MEDFIAGGAAALAAITCMHPVDVVKTRLQFQGEAGGKGSVYRGVFSSLVAIGRSEGLSGLYRGILPAYALQFTVTATRFGVYSVAKGVVGDKQSKLGNFGLAAASGACGGVLGTPFFALKTRAQTYSSCKEMAVGAQHQPQGFVASFVGIYRQEGLKGYMRGMNAFVPRVVMYGAAQLGVYDLTKPFLKDFFHMQEGIQLHFVSAFTAAVAAVTAIQPFDFLTARLQNQPVDPVSKKGVYYDGLMDCAIKSIRKEGPTCLLKGCWANICRMGPYTVLVLMFFEQFKRLRHAKA